jgi:hypothetical protein
VHDGDEHGVVGQGGAHRGRVHQALAIHAHLHPQGPFS